MSATTPTSDDRWYQLGPMPPQSCVIPTPGVGRCWKCGQLIYSHQYHACPRDYQAIPWQPMPYPVIPPPMPAPVKTTVTTTFRPKKRRPDGEAMRADEV